VKLSRPLARSRAFLHAPHAQRRHGGDHFREFAELERARTRDDGAADNPAMG